MKYVFLLISQPKYRLNLRQLKNHSFFEGLEWDRLLAKGYPAPLIPETKAHHH
jgi:hypothetical protein